MEKYDALRSIRDSIEQVKRLPKFEGKSKMLIYMGNLYNMVIRHKAVGNYNELCAIEAERMFIGMSDQLKTIKEATK